MRALAALAFALATASPAVAATIEARVADARGHAVPDAVIYAIPAGRTLPLAKKTAIMDQKNRMFIPHVLPVQVGTAVRFPNSDDIRHQVYSFSPAKTFQLPLYAGTPATPLVFDKAGVVTLGCNIHDQMNAFIVVVETPYFGKTSADGRVTLDDLESGRYTLHAWYPDMRTEPQPQSVTLKGDERITVSFVSHGRS
jgi:plastocyanin